MSPILSQSTRSLHVEAAIRAHDGEGEAARDRDAAPAPAQRAEWSVLLNFL